MDINNLPTEKEYFEKNKFVDNMQQKAIFKCSCGGTVWVDLTMVLTCYPPKHRAECDKCHKVFFV